MKIWQTIQVYDGMLQVVFTTASYVAAVKRFEDLAQQAGCQPEETPHPERRAFNEHGLGVYLISVDFTLQAVYGNRVSF